MNTVADRSRRRKPPAPKTVPPIPEGAWLDWYPTAAKFLARWANAVAVLHTVSAEFNALASMIEQNPSTDGAVNALQPHYRRFGLIAAAVEEACDAAKNAPPIRGMLDAMEPDDENGGDE